MPRRKSSTALGRVTSHDVAEKAGVSQSTVSRVFSGDERLSDSTRKKVLEVAKSLGYKPNAIARSLITKRTQIIGLVASHMTNPYFPLVLQAFTQRLHELGWKVLLITASDTTGSAEEADELLSEILAYQVDGLIIVSAALNKRITEEALERGIPVLLFSHNAPSLGVSSVSCDDARAGREVANMFLDSGCKRVAYIGGEDLTNNLDRLNGFLDRLAERNVTDCQIVRGIVTYEGGYEAAMRLLQSSHPPDAIFCSNDIPAFGVLDAARKLGVKVPDELSVIGFDDIPMAQWASYDLTSIRQPTQAMIEASVESLLERIKDRNHDSVIKLLPATLIKRSSAR